VLKVTVGDVLWVQYNHPQHLNAEQAYHRTQSVRYGKSFQYLSSMMYLTSFIIDARTRRITIRNDVKIIPKFVQMERISSFQFQPGFILQVATVASAARLRYLKFLAVG
jgi:hypothetical protein